MVEIQYSNQVQRYSLFTHKLQIMLDFKSQNLVSYSADSLVITNAFISTQSMVSPVKNGLSQSGFSITNTYVRSSKEELYHFILINNERSSSSLTSLFLKKQKLEIVKSFQDIAIIDKDSPGGSEWQKPPGNKQNNSKVEITI